MEAESNKTYPFDYEELEDTEELRNYFSNTFKKVIRVGANGYFFYKGFENIISDIFNMPLRDTDTFVLGYSRSGTTWTQELVWLLQNDCDFDKAKATPLSKRFPFIESKFFTTFPRLKDYTKTVGYKQFIEEVFLVDPKYLNTLPSPRFMKSHLPISLLPPSLLDTAKVVYVARDPRDAAVSFFYHMKSWNFIARDREFKTFWSYFVQNKVLWCPYFENVKEAWRHRNHQNLFFLFYEELSQDLIGVARRLATFFGKKYSENQFQDLSHHLEFNNFKNNKSVNREKGYKAGYIEGRFIRKGLCGGWREHFDAEMSLQAERWIADNLRDTDLQYPTTQ